MLSLTKRERRLGSVSTAYPLVGVGSQWCEQDNCLAPPAGSLVPNEPDDWRRSFRPGRANACRNLYRTRWQSV